IKRAIVLASQTRITAAVAYFFIPDEPSSATFLTPEERAEVVRRLEDDNNGLAQEYGMVYFWQAVKDWKTYAYSMFALRFSNLGARGEL
ncbi:hypothetical protein FRC09_018709, partial [Ceratobasidium sp. 395]